MLSSSIHEAKIPLAISQLRADNQAPVVSKHADGGNSRVFKVNFQDGETWAIRLPISPRDPRPEFSTSLVEAEARVLKELETKGFQWSPKLHGYSSTFDNPIGHPFLAMSWIPGNKLIWTEDFPAQPLRDKILKQVAEIQTSLIECTKETSMFKEELARPIDLQLV